jgi:hypothetical protein
LVHALLYLLFPYGLDLLDLSLFLLLLLLLQSLGLNIGVCLLLPFSFRLRKLPFRTPLPSKSNDRPFAVTAALGNIRNVALVVSYFFGVF